MITGNPGPSGTRKAAILLSFLGEEAAAPILRNLEESELERVTEEIAKLAHIPMEATLEVVEEYRQIMAAQEYTAVGGEDVATRLLVEALGEDGANKMMQRLSSSEARPSFDAASMQKVDPQQLARVMAGEQAQTRALILGNLDPRQASSLLMKLEPQDRADCIKRLATIGNFSPSAAAKVSTVLKRRLRASREQRKQEKPGFQNLAEMMNRLDSSTAREILETIENQEPTLAIRIRDLMFTFENFLEVPEPDLRELMNAIDKKVLMIALKGASEELRSRIYRTMSSRAVEMMKEDSEMMGPVRSKEVMKAQAEIVSIARKLEAEGKIVLKSQGDDEYVL
jgi:flagellar motor switch protein FliG